MTENLAAAAVITFVIGFLKKAAWFPWLTTETARVNRVAAILLSGVATLGIHATFNAQSHQLLITGLSLTTIGVGAYHWLIQFVYTHGWFKATSASDQILQLLQQIVASSNEVSLSGDDQKLLQQVLASRSADVSKTP